MSTRHPSIPWHPPIPWHPDPAEMVRNCPSCREDYSNATPCACEPDDTDLPDWYGNFCITRRTTMSDANTGGRPVPGDDYPMTPDDWDTPHTEAAARLERDAETLRDLAAGHFASDTLCEIAQRLADAGAELETALRMHQVQFERANRLEAERDALRQRIRTLEDLEAIRSDR